MVFIDPHDSIPTFTSPTRVVSVGLGHREREAMVRGRPGTWFFASLMDLFFGKPPEDGNLGVFGHLGE